MPGIWESAGREKGKIREGSIQINPREDKKPKPRNERRVVGMVGMGERQDLVRRASVSPACHMGHGIWGVVYSLSSLAFAFRFLNFLCWLFFLLVYEI